MKADDAAVIRQPARRDGIGQEGFQFHPFVGGGGERDAWLMARSEFREPAVAKSGRIQTDSSRLRTRSSASAPSASSSFDDKRRISISSSRRVVGEVDVKRHAAPQAGVSLHEPPSGQDIQQEPPPSRRAFSISWTIVLIASSP